MSEQSEREAYNEAAREYHEGKEREEMDRPMFTQRDMDAAVQGEREVIAAAIAQLVACEKNDRWIDSTTHVENVARELRALMEGKA